MEAADAVLLLVELALLAKPDLIRLPDQVDRTVSDLRQIRFNDEGILGLLEALASGEKIDPENARKRLSDFNDAEWRVDAASRRLARGTSRGPRKTNDKLDLIRNNKLEVRASVQAAINGFLQSDFEADRSSVQQLCSAIRTLNSTIDDTEEALLKGRQ